MGKILNKKEYINESIRQFLVHIKYLVDKKTGLLFHGWTFIERHNFAEARWARGNCWFTAGIPDYLEIVDELDEGVKAYLLSTLHSQIKMLQKLQNPNGMWHTLLDDSFSYVETSATAGFAYGILKSVRMGYIDKKYVDMGLKAADAVVKRINDEGTVTEVSYGTGMGRDLGFYRNIPLCPMTYGQALAIIMLTEVL
jgi:unsaturated rhamnogalacturonyl hydrolase